MVPVVDRNGLRPIFGLVIRFILSFLAALALVSGSSAVAAMTPPQATQSGDCTMVEARTADAPLHHGQMACCTSDCTIMGIPAIANPVAGSLSEMMFARIPPAPGRVAVLASLSLAAEDPPPRIWPS